MPSKESAFSVGEDNPPTTETCLQHPVLGLEVFDEAFLLPGEPRSERDDQILRQRRCLDDGASLPQAVASCSLDLDSVSGNYRVHLWNHAKAIIACDFFIAVTVTFQLLYVFVLIHHGSRRLVHFNVTAHPTAAWTLQQLREAIGFEQGYRYLLHDRDGIFVRHVDESIERIGMRVLRSPPRSPMANAVCERLIGTMRRECLDWMIPISEAHLRSILKIWMRHYNRSRPHMSLGPRVPDPPSKPAALQSQQSRHRIREGLVVLAKSVLGGLHHEYSLAPAVA
jgi:hypothetical protein